MDAGGTIRSFGKALEMIGLHGSAEPGRRDAARRHSTKMATQLASYSICRKGGVVK
jgi:hypothetical protein